MGNLYKILAWKPESQRSIGRPVRSWEDNIKFLFIEDIKCKIWVELGSFSIGSSTRML
jgi:hypothetical protein